jgi:class 3 adenylate cyclase/tetratricopeptide (TPR) repeat protein
MALCPNCGEENPDRARLCMMCGTALGKGSQPQAEERKVVSILFVDLVGFTARSHAADPEDVRAALGPYHALLKREIERFGGAVEKFIGDAVMAVFGAPVAHEDDAERAVRAALRITEAIAELNASSALDLSLRAAVNTGEGLVALGARPEAGEGMVTGDVVNTASRLQNVAPVNGVVVGEVTFRSTKHVIDYEELDAVTVKGKPDAVTVWRAVSAKSRFGVDADMAAKTPFIGRDYELDLLKGSFKRALRESSIQLVTVLGEPGVGKSRLLTEFFSFIDDQEELIFWRQGRSLPYGEGITFWALGEIIKAHAGILESDGSESAIGKLKDAIGSVVQETSEQSWFLSRLAPLVGIEISAGASPQKEESFTAWRRFLEAVAEQGPLVLAFEDLHWADPSLLEFIEHLVDWVTGVPIFVVCTARPELYDKHPNWGGGKRNFNILALSPLDDSETAQLISSLLSQAVLPAEIHSALLERAGGNPLYAEEFIRMLWDRHILTRKGKVLAVDKHADIPVPENVYALIAARLDTLSSERKRLLQDASVAGKVFWSGAIAAIGEADPHAVRRGLHELGGKEMVRRSRTSSIAGHDEYRFWHALIRDVSYGQIPRAQRAKKHQAMACWIEDTAERLDDHAEVIAHHYSTALELARGSGASDIDKLEQQTSRFLVKAADRTRRVDPEKALTLYRQALDLLSPHDDRTPHVLGEAGIASHDLGLLAESQDYLELAITEFSAREDLTGQAMAMGRLTRVLRDQGHSDQGHELLMGAVELLEREGLGEQLSIAYKFVAFEALLTSDLDAALAWANKALVVADRCASNLARGRALDVRGMVRCESGDLDGVKDLREAIRISEAAGDIGDAVTSYNNLGDFTRLGEGPGKGLELNKRAQDLGHSHGFTGEALWAEHGTLPMLFELGRWDELLVSASRLVAWSHDHEATFMESVSAISKAHVLVHRGQTRDALSLQETFLPLLRGMGELESLAPSLQVAALIHARLGDDTTALGLVREFEQKTELASPYRARYLPDVVRILGATGRGDHASRLLVPERDVSFVRDRHAVVTAQAIVMEATGELEQSVALYNDAARRWSEYGFVLEEGQALLGTGRCLIALGRTSEAAAPLHQAREIFTTLGAKLLVDETDGCLEQTTALSS